MEGQAANFRGDTQAMYMLYKDARFATVAVSTAQQSPPRRRAPELLRVFVCPAVRRKLMDTYSADCLGSQIGSSILPVFDGIPSSHALRSLILAAFSDYLHKKVNKGLSPSLDRSAGRRQVLRRAELAARREHELAVEYQLLSKLQAPYFEGFVFGHFWRAPGAIHTGRAYQRLNWPKWARRLPSCSACCLAMPRMARCSWSAVRVAYGPDFDSWKCVAGMRP